MKILLALAGIGYVGLGGYLCYMKIENSGWLLIVGILILLWCATDINYAKGDE